MIISLDSETTGKDLYHGAKPFFITTCDEHDNQRFWEWPVDPLTREPEIPGDDIAEIQQLIDDAETIIFQNCKFDIAALGTIGIDWTDEHWAKTFDTLIAAHLLASNHPHNLTALAIEYVGVNIEPVELALEKAVQECRRWARSNAPDWLIAKEGLPMMPSAKGSKGDKEERTWAYDMWLPAAVARARRLPTQPAHHYYNVLQEYSNTDSAVTIKVWQEQLRQIEERKLWSIYEARLELLPVLFAMEQRGLTISRPRLEELYTRYRKESYEANEECIDIAAQFGYNLEMPKGASPNNSLRSFFYNVMQFKSIYDPKSKSGNATLNKAAMEQYEYTYPKDTTEGKFIRTLKGKRSRDTACAYLLGYTRFWLPMEGSDASKSYRIDNEQDYVESRQDGTDSSDSKDSVLDLDSWKVKGRLWDDVDSDTEDDLHSPNSLPQSNSSDTSIEEGSTPLRQSELCKPSSSISGDRQGQLRRQAQKGASSKGSNSRVRNDAGSSGERDRVSLGSSDGESSFRDSKKMQRGRVTKEGSEGSRIESISSECYSNKKKLEACVSQYYVLHPKLNPTGTDTLRMSSNDPNEQNISKKESFNLRYCFGPAEGREWYSMDAKNLELRIPAYESGEPMMVKLFDDMKSPPYFGSYHMLIFDILHPEKFAEHGMKAKEVYESTWYQRTKNGNFAVTYGAIEESGTADRAYGIPGAQRMIKERLKAMAALNDKYIKIAQRLGYVETLPDRTVDPERGYPLLVTRSAYGGIKPTVPFNYHTQGTACWWMMRAMVKVHNFLKRINTGMVFAGRRWAGGYHIVMNVHDELVFDFPSGRGRKGIPADKPWEYNLPILRHVQKLMESCGDDIGIKTPVDVEYHAISWDKGVKL